MKGPNLHGREAAGTFEAATDLLIDKLERQVERARDKRTLERRRRAQHDVLATPPEPPAPEAEESAAWVRGMLDLNVRRRPRADASEGPGLPALLRVADTRRSGSATARGGAVLAA